ncbi:hypothetical protein Tco_0632339 [Tanacetum coccineum]
MRATTPSTYHPLLPSRTPLLLPIPLPAPSTSRIADIPEADTPPRKRLLLTTPRPSCEVGEGSAAAAARQPRPTMAHRVDYSLVDTMETKFRDTERRMMTALEMVNMRKDHAAVRAKIEVLRRERIAYEQESMETCQALARSEAHCRTLEARVTVLETEGEIKKIETEMWNLKVKGTDVVAYSRRFQQLALMCSRMFPEEIDKIEKYIGGLPDMIHGSVKASKPKTMQEAIEFTIELMDEKTHAYAEHQAEKKKRYADLPKNNQNQQ